MIIGVTGNSGSGKTLISSLLKKEYDAEVIDADKVVKEMSVNGTEYFNEIIKTFGKEVLLGNGRLNRKELANIVFKDNKKKEQLDLITFKYVVDEIKRRVKLSKNNIVIIDAPLLIESKLNKICCVVISIVADKDIRINRICVRDGIDVKEGILRINAQQKNDFYIKNSDYVIENNNDCNLEKHIENIKELIKHKIK